MAAGTMTLTGVGESLRARRGKGEDGWTLIELLILIALLGILTAIILPILFQTLTRAKFQRCVADLRLIEFEIEQYELREGRFPDELGELDVSLPIDPWGQSYQYFVFRGPGWRGRARKDRFLVPINSFYDLYSIGIDGETRPPLQNPKSHDDVVRANDGTFYGYGRDF